MTRKARQTSKGASSNIPKNKGYPAAGEPVSLVYPAAGERVSLIYPAAGEPVSSYTRQLESQIFMGGDWLEVK